MENFVNKHYNKIYRFFEIMLGVSTWSLLTSPIWLGILYPPAIVYLLTFFTVWWSYMAFRQSIGLFLGYSRYKSEIGVDWYEECKKLDFPSLPDQELLPNSLNELKQLLVIPVVNEPTQVLRDSLDSIFNQSFPPSNIVIAYTVEERFHELAIENIKEAMEGREEKLAGFMIFVHPAGIVGEAVGDGGANRAWGCSHAVEELKSRGENVRNYIFSNLDSDHVFHPEFYARVAHLYLTSIERDNHFYTSAVPLFENNLWRVPLPMRIEANSVTLAVASDWGITNEKVKKTFSAFSVSLQTLIDADYFNVSLGADDTIFFWRAYFAKDGNFDGKPFFVPYSADAVEGKNYWSTYKSLYKQLLRWGWGAIDFPLSVTEFLRNNRVKFLSKINWFFRHIMERVFLTNIVFLITFGFGLVTLVNPNVKQSSFAYSLPNIMSIILTITLIFLIPTTFFRRAFTSTPPRDWPLWKKATVWLEGPLILFNLLTFSFWPTIHAQTKILLGKKMKDLYHTPKVR